MYRDEIAKLYEDIIPKIDKYLRGFEEKNGTFEYCGDEYIILDEEEPHEDEEGVRVIEGEATRIETIAFDLPYENSLDDMVISIDVFRYQRVESDFFDVSFLGERKIRREEIGN